MNSTERKINTLELRCGALVNRGMYYRLALSEIAKGEGPYSKDQLKHADNCIDAMKQIANQSLEGTWNFEDFGESNENCLREKRSNVVYSHLPWSDYSCRGCLQWSGEDLDDDTANYMCHECRSEMQRYEKKRKTNKLEWS